MKKFTLAIYDRNQIGRGELHFNERGQILGARGTLLTQMRAAKAGESVTEYLLKELVQNPDQYLFRPQQLQVFEQAVRGRGLDRDER